MELGEWELDRMGNPQLGGGAFMTARNWVLFGQLILQNGAWEGEQILPADALAECFIPTETNPGYGLTWWLAYPGASYATHLGESMTGITTAAHVAAGAFDQRLYVIPSLDMVVVRFGRGHRLWSDREFFEALLG
jgi:CubicO group peptidase (beta-lactamase class C family)